MITAEQMLIYVLLLGFSTASVAAPTHKDDHDDFFLSIILKNNDLICEWWSEE